MLFRILGPLEVIAENGPVRIPGHRRRSLLIALLTRPGDVVCVDRLVEWLWPAGTPRSPLATLQAHVSMLRRILEPDRSPWSPPSVLVTRPPGYLLRVAPEELDSLCFEALVEQGRLTLDSGDAAGARRLLLDALALWRGDALSDVAFLEAAQAEIRRLEELHLSSLVLRIEADLALGRHLEVVPELTRLIMANPLNEKLYSQLMLALCRCGRRAEALSVYRRARDVLASEMALEPGPDLRRMEAAIVSGDQGCPDPSGRAEPLPV
jgi:SARP family transcriptional regulator, regulator of embCAB operon